ncbi:hypothetical protein ACS0TY_028560 [Phlomoides rotata]
MDDDTLEMGIGMILHDDSDSFISCRSLIFPGAYCVEVGEAMWLLEALSWIKQLGLEKEKNEMDAKMVVNALCSSDVAIPVSHDFIKAFKREMSSMFLVSVDYVNRATNEN